MPTDGPIEVINSVPHMTACDLMKVYFVGPRSEWEKLKSTIMNSSSYSQYFTARRSNVVAWLTLLFKVNWYYKLIADKVSSEFPSEVEFANLTKFLVENAVVVDSEAEIGIETVTSCDVAVHEIASTSDAIPVENSDCLPAVCLMPKNPDTTNGSTVGRTILNSLTIHVSKSTNVPLNEFLENDRYFFGTFPVLFLLGKLIQICV